MLTPPVVPVKRVAQLVEKSRKHVAKAKKNRFFMLVCFRRLKLTKNDNMGM
jgi:hypothetical protein